MRSELIGVGSEVIVQGRENLSATVVQIASGRVQCALQDGRTVWVPEDRVVHQAEATKLAVEGAVGNPLLSARAEAGPSALPVGGVASGAVPFGSEAPFPQDLLGARSDAVEAPTLSANQMRAGTVDPSLVSAMPGVSVRPHDRPRVPVVWLSVATILTGVCLFYQLQINDREQAATWGTWLGFPLLAAAGLAVLSQEMRSLRGVAQVFVMSSLVGLFFAYFAGAFQAAPDGSSQAYASERAVEPGSDASNPQTASGIGGLRPSAAKEIAQDYNLAMRAQNFDVAKKLFSKGAELQLVGGLPGNAETLRLHLKQYTDRGKYTRTWRNVRIKQRDGAAYAQYTVEELVELPDKAKTIERHTYREVLRIEKIDGEPKIVELTAK